MTETSSTGSFGDACGCAGADCACDVESTALTDSDATSDVTADSLVSGDLVRLDGDATLDHVVPTERGFIIGDGLTRPRRTVSGRSTTGQMPTGDLPAASPHQLFPVAWDAAAPLVPSRGGGLYVGFGPGPGGCKVGDIKKRSCRLVEYVITPAGRDPGELEDVRKAIRHARAVNFIAGVLTGRPATKVATTILNAHKEAAEDAFENALDRIFKKVKEDHAKTCGWWIVATVEWEVCVEAWFGASTKWETKEKQAVLTAPDGWRHQALVEGSCGKDKATRWKYQKVASALRGMDADPVTRADKKEYHRFLRHVVRQAREICPEAAR